MKRLRRLVELVCGVDPGLRRMLHYWAATCLLYVACIVQILVQIDHGFSDPAVAHPLIRYGCAVAAGFYLLIRFSARIGLKPDQLAVSQALFSLVCTMFLYAISGPLRGATLVMTVVVIAFCMFAARPRQTLMLSLTALAGMGATMWYLAASDPARFPPAQEAQSFGYLAAALLSTALLSGEMHKLRSRLKHQRRELSDALDTIRVLATVDELTSLVNRRRMHEVLAAEERRQPSTRGTCIALLDMDFFKQVNDQCGHAAGDSVLRCFSQAARACLRGEDVLARWGGEEFLLLLPDASLDDARGVLERMLDGVHAMPVPGVEGRRISFSAGLATRQPGEPFADAIHRADKALYRAKEEGRDRIVSA
ncbi:diguanylate cyclase [uncultured Massilia sp.]|uniref:GGDEF domain-containing protein n=1 Tax=uncultured Massilia sp. TaxID=169973 RepID=UPI00258C5F47|nr:GGDEF domain-containing protein [uncultured Massilia sp.]